MTRIGESPAVSVLVTVFNREQYLAACLDSILASSWEDFEVVIVDDASTDASREIAARYARSHSRVRFHKNESNLGDYPNRARAAALAKGAYIKYVDSDDIIYRHSLATMVEGMRSNPDAALGLSHSLPEDEQPYPWKLTSAEAWKKEFLGDGCMGSGPTGAIIKADALREAGGFRSWGVLSDTDMWYRMSARWPIVLFPPGLVWWRRHADQEFKRDDAASTYLRKGFELGIESLASADNPMTADETKKALLRLRRRYARRVMSIATLGRSPSVARRLAREAGLTTEELLQGLRKQP